MSGLNRTWLAGSNPAFRIDTFGRDLYVITHTVTLKKIHAWQQGGAKSPKKLSLGAFAGANLSVRLLPETKSLIVFVKMCGRFTLKSPSRIKFDRINRSNLPPLFPRYNIAPSQDVLTIILRGVEREAILLQWGLIPSWSKEAKGFINARSETLEEKPSFSESFKERRCLIVADGFYEWGQRSARSKQPYYFQMHDESQFAFAGIWDQWRGNENSITSCAIITTTANDLLAPIHSRMPVLLDQESQDAWLDGDSKPAVLRSLLTPFPAFKMKSHAVSYDVNYPKVDDEHLVRPVEPNLGFTPSLF